jgi:RND family efflux transporter MFP subunit
MTRIALFLLGALLAAGGCKPPLPPGTDKPQQKTNVEVWIVEPRDLVEEIVLPGLVRPDLSVRLSAEVGGVIEKITVQKGDDVEPGQVLLVVDKSDLLNLKKQALAQVKSLSARLQEVELGAREEQIRQAEAAVAAALSALTLARTVAERRRSLVKEKVLPQEALDVAEGQVQQAKAGYEGTREVLALARKGARKETKDALRSQIEAAETAVVLVESRIAKTVIKSPIQGVVHMRMADENEFAAPGMPLFEIVRKSAVKITLGVPERIFTRLSEGDDVEVHIRALGATLTTQITRTAFMADPMTQTFEVEMTLQNPVTARVNNPARDTEKSVLLRPGLIAEIRLSLGVRRNAVAIPASALIMDGANLFVCVELNGSAKTRPVRIGLKHNGLLEILEGLDIGDRLIVAGQKYVRDGDDVDVVKERKGALPQ